MADWLGFGGGGLISVALEVSSFSSLGGAAPSRALNIFELLIVIIATGWCCRNRGMMCELTSQLWGASSI